MATKTKVRLIKWSDPPENASSQKTTRRNNLNGWDALLAKLAEKPGEWALIRTSNRRVTITQAYSERRFKDFQFVSRKYFVGNQPKFGVWGRKKPPISVEEITVTGQDVIVKEQFTELTDTI